MDAETIYEIARYREFEHPDELIDRIQLLRNADGSLTLWHADGRQTPCAGDDPVAVIAADADLHGVRANEMTQIHGTSELCAELPLLLQMIDDDAHPEQFNVYVADDSWGVVRTADRMWTLPYDYYDLRPVFIDEWANMSFTETASMTSGLDRTCLGVITPVLVADYYRPDEDTDRMTFSRRDNDAEMVVDWLLRGHMSRYFFREREGGQALLTQLFVQAANSPETAIEISGDRLAAGLVTAGDFGTGSTAVWELRLRMDPALIDDVLARLRECGGEVAAAVDGGLHPDSPAGQARAVALRALDERSGCRRSPLS